MALTTVNGNVGGADFKIGAQSYRTVLNQFRVIMDVPELDATTFSDEPNENSEPGVTRAFFDVAGLMKTGAPEAGPFMPPPTNVALVFQFAGVNNQISFLANFTRAEAIRAANVNGIINGSGRSKGAITITWVRI